MVTVMQADAELVLPPLFVLITKSRNMTEAHYLTPFFHLDGQMILFVDMAHLSSLSESIV